MGESKTKIKFEEKLFKLPDYARNKGGILDDQDLMAYFGSEELDAEKFERVLECLEANKIEFLNVVDAEEEIFLEEDPVLLEPE